MTFTPRVVDIFHGDAVAGSDCVQGLQEAADAGVWGIIHKSSQGSNYKDVAYDRRRLAAEKVGLLWGAYHFNDSTPIKDQVDNFIDSANPDDRTLMVLDFEDNAKGNMTMHDAVVFMKSVEDKIGRSCAIYSGNRLKENIGKLGHDDLAYITSKRLWLCQYGPVAHIPKGFSNYWLWQYTGDGVGSVPHYVPGITVPGGRGIDLNVYAGTKEQLTSEWAG